MSKKNVSFISLEFMVGLFFIGAIIIFIYLTVIVNGKDVFFSKDKTIINVHFSSVETLNKNDKVYCMGVNVGRVKDFDFSEDGNDIIVKINLEKPIIFREGYLIEIRNLSLLGGKYVHIYPGSPSGKKISEGTILRGKSPVDIIQEASNLIERLREDETLFRTKFLEGEFVENLKSASQNLNKILDTVNNGEGSFAKILKDPSFYEEAKKTFSQVENAANELKILLTDTREGKGTIGKLFTDEKIYEDFKATVEDIRKFSANLGEGKGSLGKISSDDGMLYNQLSEAVESLNKVAVKLSEGQGTIGKLLNDDTLYFETKTAINQLRGAVEDFREQAPIATLGSMLLGAL
ncbi:MAG TPA: MlaD family protein [Victivallales bacterium]|nr:MlaD family protein [Victivallales bacterium]HRR28283.1 MlaD family protein [Victivallales bacterium]HRU00947.1 MlaD family protein [Victivallales bacterium]